MGTTGDAPTKLSAALASIQISKYEYKPLQHDRSIRILDLEPAANEDATLHASLREVAFSDEPEYEAISYAWGASDLTTPLELPEGTLHLTDSLASGLRRFRRADVSRSLWADAVCIDQGSTSEKSRQVAQMGSVYRNATRCLIWLGYPTGSEAAAKNFMAAYATIVASRERYGISVTPTGDVLGSWIAGIPDEGPVREALEKIPVDFDWNGADEFYSSTWFQRRWCLQEIVLSSEAEIHYGVHNMNWHDFIVAAHIVWRSVMKTKAANLRLPYNFLWTRSLDEARILFRKGARLVVFLQRFPFLVCSDDRDYIYSMLGLRSSQDIDIWPDYTKSSVQVFKQTVRKMYLKDTQASIGLLSQAGLAQRFAPARSRGHRNTVHQNIPALDEVFKELPSWVPDWRIHNDFYPFLNGAGPKYFEAASQFHPYVQSTDEGSFSIFAHIIGVISSRKDLGTETDMYFNEQRDKLLEWKTWFDEQCTQRAPLPRAEDPLLIFLRTIVADQNAATIPNTLRKTLSADELVSLWNQLITTTYHDHSPTEHFEIDGSAPRLAGTADSPTGLINHFSDLFSLRIALRQLLNDRQMFATEMGFIGLGPAVAREGDAVIFFCGLPSPFIVRPLADQSGFYLIGDCYLHGIMYGQLKDFLKKSQEWAWCTLK